MLTFVVGLVCLIAGLKLVVRRSYRHSRRLSSAFAFIVRQFVMAYRRLRGTPFTFSVVVTGTFHLSEHVTGLMLVIMHLLHLPSTAFIVELTNSYHLGSFHTHSKRFGLGLKLMTWQILLHLPSTAFIVELPNSYHLGSFHIHSKIFGLGLKLMTWQILQQLLVELAFITENQRLITVLTFMTVGRNPQNIQKVTQLTTVLAFVKNRAC